jgi:hypothetical protein
MRCAGHEARMGLIRSAYSVSLGIPERERSIGGTKRARKDIKIDLRGIGWGRMDWIHLAQDRDQWRGYLLSV